MLQFLLFALLVFPVQTGEENPFDEALGKLGLTEADLGFEPKAYWARFPNPDLIPYKPVLFMDLFAEPTRIYDVVRLMALSVEDYLDPRYMEKNTNALYKVAYYTGLEKKVGVFRAYGSALSLTPTEKDPLLNALRMIFAHAGKAFDYRVLGKPADWPRTEVDFRAAIEPLEPEVERALAQGLLSALEARQWIDTALRNVDRKDLLEVWRLRDLSETQFDAMEYYPAVDDVAEALDEQSLYYGGMKIIEAVEILKKNLQGIENTPKLDLETPFGRVVLAGKEDDVHRCSDAFFIVDLGGNDTYIGPAGATPRPDMPVALCLDLAGDDKYVNEEKGMPAQGAAIFGAAVLLDAEGDDLYQSRYLSQGAGQFGLGMLADLGGDDRYEMQIAGQGAGLFGIGLQIDMHGNDEFRLCGDGQGYGGVGGVGTLVDVHGDDLYYAEPLAEKFFRPDYHGWGVYNYSYAQGAGIGRRGDISDGHSWAGGQGTLIDLNGNDRYVGGTWTLGTGYWFGMGFFYDQAGDDLYESCTFAQASGAHFCIAALIDEAGDDKHTFYGPSTCNAGFGHDYTVALLLDRSGNDVYEAFDGCIGRAIRISQAFFLDLGGDDLYRVKKDAACIGSTDAGTSRDRLTLDFTYELYSKQIAVFLDTGGEDRYVEAEGEKKGEGIWEWGTETVSDRFRNNDTWFGPAAGDPLSRGRHFGVGMDVKAGGGIPWSGDRFSSIHEEE